ncbi:MAG: class I SAM-dependent methyltransferase [Patescibacteria group bacterium]
MQENIWEKEYRDPQLITLGVEAIQAIKDWVRFLRKEKNVEFSSLKILDLGCGNGKNSIYIADQGEDNEIVGIDISKTAIEYARKLAEEKNLKAAFLQQSIGMTFPFPNTHFDLVLDVTSSNSLNEKEREIYLKETQRVMKSGSYLFVRALCKDGDSNAKILLKTNPGKEKDTYVMPEFGLTERVFSKEDFMTIYSSFFTLLYLEKETHYTKFKDRSYKRNFWVAYFIKP